MIKLLLLSVFSISFLHGFSQQDSLLKNFKFRNSKFQAINLDIGSSSQFNRAELGSGTNKNSNSGGGLGAGYYAAKSTDKLLFTAAAGLGANFNFSKSTSTNENNKNNSFTTLPRVSVLNKWFNKNKFIELGTAATANIYTNKATNTVTTMVSKRNQIEYSLATNTGIGTGRLENITDMQNALWLTKALEASGSISHTLSAAELNELGRTITKANNTRVLDGRKRTQFVLATVDNFFQQKGLVGKTDISYFSNLNDILFFAFNTQRLSGTEKYIRFTPAIAGYYYNNTQNSNIDKDKQRTDVKSLALSIGFNKYAPKNLIHQNNYGAALKLSYDDIDFAYRFFTSGIITSELTGISTLKKAAVDLFFEHAIYPNTRTIINFNLQTQGGYQALNKQTDFFGQVSLSGSLSYFISYRTRLNCNLGTIYRNNVNEIGRYIELIPNTIHLYANAGLNISI
jgi:hypothetical protein